MKDSTHQNTNCGPVKPSERLLILDILRGFAIFAILLVNIHFYSRPLFMIFNLHDKNVSLLDYLVQASTVLFVSEKFYSILALLFGIGMAIIFERTRLKKAHFGSIYIRRLIGLFIIGITHALLFYAGDFIGNYAILGFFLIFFKNRKSKTILIFSIIILLFPVFKRIHTVLTFQPPNQTVQSTLSPEDLAKIRQERINRLIQKSVNTYGNGTISQIFTLRLKETRLQYSSLPFIGWKILSMFLLGLWCWKKGIVQSLAQNLNFIKKVMWISLIIGVLGCSFNLYNQLIPSRNLYLHILAFLGNQLGAPALGIFYITGIILLYYNGIGKKFFSLFSSVGRMAMSNYIFQSLIFTTIFYSYGLGLYYKTGYTLNLLFVIVFFPLQVILSNLWLKKFKYGPLEWVLRAFVYLKRPAMK